jgi:hypothetical protein
VHVDRNWAMVTCCNQFRWLEALIRTSIRSRCSTATQENQRPDFRPRASEDITFLTSDFEIPNCRAMTAGLTPALKAARTAFSLPFLSNLAPSSAAGSTACGSGASVDASFDGDSVTRPRRLASAVTAARRASISASSSRASAPAKSLGRKWRGCEARLSCPALVVWTVGRSDGFVVVEVENRSGVSVDRRAGMATNYGAAISPLATLLFQTARTELNRFPTRT